VDDQEQPTTPPESGEPEDEVRAWLERRFITLVSHQLKSPLVAVRQYLDLLQEDARSRSDAEHTLPWLERSTVRLDEALSIVEDWLALARVEAGGFTRPDACCDLAAVLEQLVAGFQEAAAAKELRVELAPLPGPLKVQGDHHSLTAALGHVIENAIRYNRQGGSVSISVQSPTEPAQEQVCVEVVDTGIGIPQAFLPKLFTEFHRASSKASRGIPGTGLGLAISSRIVQELGGSITVESTEGLGSRFRLSLPLCRAELPASHE